MLSCVDKILRKYVQSVFPASALCVLLIDTLLGKLMDGWVDNILDQQVINLCVQGNKIPPDWILEAARF